MPLKTNKKAVSPKKRFLRLTAIVFGILGLIILGLHIWFVNNARGILEDIVLEKSKGKFRLELSQVSFDFLSNKLKFREADLISTDSTTQPTTYRVKFRKLTLRVNSFWPLIFNNQLLLDSIKLHDPEIEVYQWKRDTTRIADKDDLSVPQEMGKLYHSMLDALDGFGIKRILINNAKLTLVNKMKPGSQPVTISNIEFDLIKNSGSLQDTTNTVDNGRSIDLSTNNQFIYLPGGRHTLAFKNFKLQLFQKRIEFDSCFISAAPTDSTRSSYNIFFKKLSLIGVDFNAMYTRNLIRADSVYCEEPLFDINLKQNASQVAAGKKGSSTQVKKEKPDLNEIIRELTGDLELAFVGVKDAGIHINMVGAKNRSLFNSHKDDFEMRGLYVNGDSSKPVVVQQFDMLVRDYRLYTDDSSTAYAFDSIHFKNNRIVLNNFSVNTTSTRARIRNVRDFRIRYFELSDLDWYELVFNENLRAREAVLYNPVINFKQNVRPVKQKTSLFESLNSLDDLMTLGRIRVINGQINTRLTGNAILNFSNVNLSVSTDALLKSQNREGLRKAVDILSFTNGKIQVGDLTATLQNVSSNASNLVHADKLKLNGKNNQLRANVNDVTIENMLLDDVQEDIVIDGLRWSSGNLFVATESQAKQKKKTGNISIRNVHGGNTAVHFKTEKLEAKTYVQNLYIDLLLKDNQGDLRLEGFRMSGNDLALVNGPLKVNSSSYLLHHDQPSVLRGVEVEKLQPGDSLTFKSPLIYFAADINQFLHKNFIINGLNIQSPVVRMSKNVTDAPRPVNSSTLSISDITLTNPDLLITSRKNDSATVITVPKSQNSIARINGLEISPGKTQISNASISTSDITIMKPKGEVLGVKDGRVEVEISDILFAKNNGVPEWRVRLDRLSLDNPNTFTFKNNSSLSIKQASAGNVILGSDYVNNFGRLLKNNVSAWLRTTNGHYIDSNTTLNWYNAHYDYVAHTLKLDSFYYRPTPSLDSFIASHPFQDDYKTFKTGAITFHGFDVDQYEKDSALVARSIDIENPLITIYRDKAPPFLSGIIKPLPVDMFKKIAFPIQIDRVNIIEGFLSYTEKHPKSRAEGTVTLTHMNGYLQHLRNRNLKETDSLGISLSAFLLDSAFLQLRVRESYIDSLGSFLMTLRLTPTTLAFLNPLLGPMSNIKIVSGVIDSFHIRAIGRDDIAYGEMNMYYHDLKIRLIKKGDPEKTSFGGKIASWIVNAFIIKKKNNGKMGLVYFERLRDRSFFNYLVKIVFSGMTTSIGAKSNRKVMKKYKRTLKEDELPAMQYD